MQQNEVFERARLARDMRFDGRFFVGVTTTGIYCRPICPAVPPRRGNATFFTTAAAAGEAGFRPCLRCRPECAPGTPAWAGTSVTVRRGLRLIESGALDDGDVETLAARLGVTSRHLRRLFTIHLGASPLAVAQTRRLQFAKRLIDETALPMRDVALAAGFGSVRRFNDAFRRSYGRPPRQLRKPGGAGGTGRGVAALSVRLPYRRPYDWPGVLAFYAQRATPGVEAIADGCYRRTLLLDGQPGLVELRESDKPGFLSLTVANVGTARLLEVVQAARDVFDLDAPVDDIGATLDGDARLSSLLRRRPGIRVPGAWGGFEMTVRAVLGQQISLQAATTIAGRITARYGTALGEERRDGLTHLFPRPEQLVRARFTDLGIVRSRAATLRAVAAAVVRGDLDFDPAQDVDAFCRRLVSIRGIGDWTAQYVAMRVLKDPDALPAGDLGLQKALSPGRRASAAELRRRADAWRPWRAYAAMLLWGAASGG